MLNGAGAPFCLETYLLWLVQRSSVLSIVDPLHINYDRFTAKVSS